MSVSEPSSSSKTDKLLISQDEVPIHFFGLEKKAIPATCKYCQKTVEPQNLHGLTEHLKLKHYSVYLSLKAVKILADKCLVKFIVGSFQPFSIVDEAGFKDFISILGVECDLPAFKDCVDNFLLKFITSGFHHFSIVEEPGFKEFIKILNPKYNLPCKKAIKSLLLELYEKQRELIGSYVKENAESVCLTVDFWTCEIENIEYMNVTAHFYAENLEKKSVLLQCVPVDDNQTLVEMLTENLKAIVEDWSISEKILYLVTKYDDTSQLTNIKNLLNLSYFGCFHIKLNNIVQDIINTATETMEKVKKIIKENSRQDKISLDFKEMNVGIKELIKDIEDNQNEVEISNFIDGVPIRWTSICLLLDKFHSLKESIQVGAASDTTQTVITNEDWIRIEALHTVLKLFYEVSQEMSKENYVTGGTAFVLVFNLTTTIDCMSKDKDLDAPILTLLESVNEKLKSVFVNIEHNFHLAQCALLDPRYKFIPFSNPEILEQVKKRVLILMNELNANNVTDKGNRKEMIENDSNTNVWNTDDPKTIEAKNQSELDLYLNDDFLYRKLCPLSWWQSNKSKYPQLYKIFKSKCNLIVTTIPCKQWFSRDGYDLNIRRSMLTSKIPEIIFLNANINNHSDESMDSSE